MTDTTALLARARDELGASLLAEPVVGVASPRGEILALSDPTRAGSVGTTARRLAQFFDDRWSPGDVAVTNDPFLGSYGVGEFTAVRAVDGGFVLARSWCGDVGGFARGGLSPDAVDTWGEGARFTTLRLVRGQAWRRQAIELLELNSRTPTLLVDNLRRLVEATAFVAAGLGSGLDSVDAPLSPARLPLASGEYRAERESAPAGPVVRLLATVSGDALCLDFTESDRQVERPAVNSPQGQTIDACLDALALAFPGLGTPPAGFRVVCGTGTVTGAELPATTGLAPYLTGRAIRHVVLRALGDAGADVGDPDRWWTERGRGRYEREIDPVSGLLRPERIDEAAGRFVAETGAV